MAWMAQAMMTHTLARAMNTGMRLIFVLLVAGFGLAPAPSRADSLVQAEGQSLRAACGGGDARVEGNHNVIVLTGPCRGLRLNGVANQVTIDLRDGATLRIEGSANRVIYRLQAGAAPAIVALGPDNLVRPDGTAVPVPASTPPAALPATLGPLDLVGDDEQKSADCAGRDVAIRGVRSAYVLRGGCRSLAVSGSLDTIQAEMADGGHIAVDGSGITVAWAVLGGGIVMERVRGVDSRVRRTDAIGGQPMR